MLDARARARAKVTDEAGSAARTLSHGRGGAGNMGKDRRSSGNAEDLVTPAIKSETYTTGRGGTGNMAKNDPNHPEVARAAQDVVAPAPHEHEVFHTGRGGAANVTKVGEDKKEHKSGAVNHLLEKVGLKK